MNKLDLGDVTVLMTILAMFAALVFVVFTFANKKLRKSRFLRFLGIMLIGMTCSLIPMGPLSVIFGFPAVLLSSILVSLLLDKEG